MEYAWTLGLSGRPRGPSGRNIGQSKADENYCENLGRDCCRVLGDVVPQERVVLVLE